MSKMKTDHLILQIVSGTVRNTINEFIMERQARGLSNNTIDFYRLNLGLFADWLDTAGVVTLDELTADTIRKYILNLGTHRNKGGVHASYRAIKTFLLWSWDEYDKLSRNPIERVKLPAPSNKPLPGISLEDIKKMINACDTKLGLRDKTILLFLLDSGVRRAEFCALNIEDVDFSTGAVEIKHGKGDKRRTVFIGQKTKRLLRKYLRTRKELRLDSPVFVTSKGERLSYAGLRQIFRRRATHAGLEKTPGAHDFRRTFAVEALRNGIDLATLSRIMGHTSVSTTMRYLHLLDDDLQIAHRKVSPVDRAL